MTAKRTTSPATTAKPAMVTGPRVSVRGRERAIVKIRELMEQYSIGFGDINPPAPKLRRGGLNHDAIPPKLIYRDPVTKKQWDGTGDTPEWLRKLETKGHNRKSFVIKQGWGRVPANTQVDGTEGEAGKPVAKKAAVKKAAAKKIVLQGVR